MCDAAPTAWKPRGCEDRPKEARGARASIESVGGSSRDGGNGEAALVSMTYLTGISGETARGGGASGGDGVPRRVTVPRRVAVTTCRGDVLGRRTGCFGGC